MTESKEPPVARIVSSRERERKIPLLDPVEYDGTVYDAVTIRRVTGKEMEDYMDLLATSDGAPLPPMIDCPRAVYDAMDDDDRFAIDQAMRDFMPRRLRATAESVSGPLNGESTSEK